MIGELALPVHEPGVLKLSLSELVTDYSSLIVCNQTVQCLESVSARNPIAFCMEASFKAHPSRGQVRSQRALGIMLSNLSASNGPKSLGLSSSNCFAS